MTDTFTVVRTPGQEYCCRGKLPREAAIEEARLHFQRRMERAQEFLSMSDEELNVRVVRGMHRQNLIEELKP